MTALEFPTPDPRTLDDTTRAFAEAVRDRYSIKKVIGRGGMGIVYLARDRRLERLVAIKSLPPSVATDESVRQRFLRETRMAGAMSHPNIVPIHGADDIDGHAFFVMALVDGDSLAARIRAEGRLEPVEVARILRDVASALDHAHNQGIIHRDIKAENILLEHTSGRALVTDFGIARLAEAAPLTATGQILGTVYYTSPEQITGEAIDARSDLYSLGVVGFLALTGAFPFDGELASAVLVAHVNKPAPKVRAIRPAIPEALAAIVDRCLSKNRSRRFATAQDLCDALDAFIRDETAVLTRGPVVRVTDTDARAVWQRAAELQADSTNSGALPVDQVREAGREAGIATRFLDRAIVERLQGAGVLSTSERSVWWAGVPLDIQCADELDGEVDPKDFEQVLTILRIGAQQQGVVTAFKHQLGWRSSGLGFWLEASVVPAEGKTLVVLTQSVRRIVLGVYLGAAAAGALIVGPLITESTYMYVMRATPHWLRDLGHTLGISRGMAEELTIVAGIIAGLAMIPLGRLAIRWLTRRAKARLAALTDAVVANLRCPVD